MMAGKTSSIDATLNTTRTAHYKRIRRRSQCKVFYLFAFTRCQHCGKVRGPKSNPKSYLVSCHGKNNWLASAQL